MFGFHPKPLVHDRIDAGRQLVRHSAIAAYRNRADAIILGLPRGGVPVAYEIAAALNVPLDLMLVRKLGTPGHEEYAMGAIAMGGIVYVDPRLRYDVHESDLKRVIQEESAELNRRNSHYRGAKPYPNLTGKHVLLVDDGIATGATMRAAALAVRKLQPARIIIAAPVGAPDSVRALGDVADEMVCLHQPPSFASVGSWYGTFPQTEDEEVLGLLAKAERFGSASTDEH
ncbi:hypothetical protein HDU87_006391 [Geranomyces variabilis]|uniref:Phosphoribosyltransferase domain-containing protein n=1 Tax=Geranomyces variabilis TaxID=109894 RepID=A0AAD5TKU7_9FUNG|nr:hypothetical protein HDU87_006391 [Geranomyces variabilis]